MTRQIILLSCACAFAIACVGGQGKEARQESDPAGDQSGNVPRATLQEHDWTTAAKGHGAAGPISAEDLARLEKRSAPGGNLTVDAGPRPQ